MIQLNNERKSNPEKCDAKFICNDKLIYAHKSILKISSSYFAAMFSGNHFIECQNNPIHLKFIEYEIFQDILDYLYTG